MKSNIYLIITFGLFIAGIGCEESNFLKKSENESQVSKRGDDESHNEGQNCMNCHYTEGKGNGWYTIAGTLYADSLGSSVNPNGTIRLFTGPSGTGKLILSIEVDARGNFYTTDPVDFSNGLYPSVINTSGISLYYDTPISIGQCNLCHSTIQSKLWIF